MERPVTVVRRVPSNALSSEEVESLRGLFDAAWRGGPEAFSAEDWDHALGGFHFMMEENGALVTHASVVERELHSSGHRLSTGYVEAVATSPTHQRRGLGSALMGEVTQYIDQAFQLGALNTGSPAFYERLGWVVWEGPTFVRTSTGPVRTAEEDGNVLVRLTPSSPELDISAPISCEWRRGDVW
jgi:aminoglycoside 2'-N-acetyltransferase I